jgi:hypothetical protein
VLILFNRGDRVIVINHDLQSYGEIGVVSQPYCSSTYVSFKNWRNTGENKTLYLNNVNLKKYDINEHVNGGNKTMAVNGNYRIATVKFLQGMNTSKEYAFALFDNDVYPNDFVLCDTTNGYSVARVNGIVHKNEWEGVTVTKEIICKVDFSEFEARKELRKQKETLKKQMDKMVADNQELILYQAIAEKNPEMAEMLKAYKALSDV